MTYKHFKEFNEDMFTKYLQADRNIRIRTNLFWDIRSLLYNIKRGDN